MHGRYLEWPRPVLDLFVLRIPCHAKSVSVGGIWLSCVRSDEFAFVSRVGQRRRRTTPADHQSNHPVSPAVLILGLRCEGHVGREGPKLSCLSSS